METIANIKVGDKVTFGGFRWSKDKTRLLKYKGAVAHAVVVESVTQSFKNQKVRG